MKYVVAGSRGFDNYQLLTQILDRIITPDDVIISGMARGADLLGVRYAKEHNISVLKYPAQWNLYGRSAGYRRNEQMAVVTDKVIVFWDDVSKGTKHMINLAHKYNKQLMIVHYTRLNSTPCR